MAGKMDKEALKKNHFWILLGVLVPVLILGLVGLWGGAAGAIAKKHEEIKGAKDKLTGTQAQGRGLLEGYEKQKVSLHSKRGGLWQQAWEQQKEVFTRPNPEQLPSLARTTFGDPLPQDEREFFRSRNSPYRKMYDDMVKGMEPTRFYGGDWRYILTWVPSWPALPTAEEIWLALEDYWVQREIVRAIREVNDSIAQFELVGDQSNARQRTFRSRLWEVNLELVDDGDERRLKGTLKNVTDRRLKLGLNNTMILEVTLTADGFSKVEFPVEGDSVAAGETIEIKPIAKHVLQPDTVARELAGVEQKFDLLTVPVKQINKVELYYTSARTISRMPLKMTEFSQKAAGPAEGEEDELSSGGDEYGGEMPSDYDMPGEGGGFGMDGAADAGKYTEGNGLRRDRYTDTTDQVRRMPLAVCLVVEQAYVQDALIAFTNSRLRFQSTQFHWHRLADDLIYYATTNADNNYLGGEEGMPSGAMPGMGPGGRPGFAPGRPGAGPARPGAGPMLPGAGPARPGAGPARPGAGPTMPGSPTYGTTPGIEASAPERSLVELSVYGTASLYNQFREMTEGEDDGAGL